MKPIEFKSNPTKRDYDELYANYVSLLGNNNLFNDTAKQIQTMKTISEKLDNTVELLNKKLAIPKQELKEHKSKTPDVSYGPAELG